MDVGKAFSVDNGFIVDELNGGPFYTGGTASPIGIDAPTSTIYTRPTASGIQIWRKFDTGVNDWRQLSAIDLPFDPSTSSLISTTTQEAIVESTTLILGTSKAFILAKYNGNAITGRYLEFWAGISSDDAPIESTAPLKCLEIISRTTSATATATLGFYDIEPTTPVLLHTTTFSATKDVVEAGTSASPLFTLPALGQLAIKVDSGAILTPHLSFITQGG